MSEEVPPVRCAYENPSCLEQLHLETALRNVADSMDKLMYIVNQVMAAHSSVTGQGFALAITAFP